MHCNADCQDCTHSSACCLDVNDSEAVFPYYSIIIIYNKPKRCNSGSIVFIKYYKYALHDSDALCVHHQEHYKL